MTLKPTCFSYALAVGFALCYTSRRRMDESRQINRLRGEVIRVIPKSPNNQETKEKLEGMPLAPLLIHYLNWMIRYVSIRPRKTIIEPTVTADPRWALHREQIYVLLDKIRSGENINPYLLIKPLSKGFSPETSKKGPEVDRWPDKDFFLNVMDFHHFHLGEKIEVAGHVERTGNVLFILQS